MSAGGMHYIADAASHLAEHPDGQHAQYAMHGGPQEGPHHHPAVHPDGRRGAQQEYAGEPPPLGLICLLQPAGMLQPIGFRRSSGGCLRL